MYNHRRRQYTCRLRLHHHLDFNGTYIDNITIESVFVEFMTDNKHLYTSDPTNYPTVPPTHYPTYYPTVPTQIPTMSSNYEVGYHSNWHDWEDDSTITDDEVWL